MSRDQITECINSINSRRRGIDRLVKSNADVTLDSGSQVDLGLKVELDTDKESGGLLVTVLVGGALEKLTSGLRKTGGCGQRNNKLLLLAAATTSSLTIGVRVGGVGGLGQTVRAEMVSELLKDILKSVLTR